ncbi:MAG: tetratricopeptide repeat protein [Syntrophobacterales bacterium]|nr:tetratricopeptide repeat protein [Syntrophobacterales bacterium]
MSKLYEIIRQMEERSQLNLPHQEIVLLNGGERDSKSSRWRPYRIVIIIGMVTLLVTLGITLGPHGFYSTRNHKSQIPSVPSVQTKNSPSYHLASSTNTLPVTPSEPPIINNHTEGKFFVNTSNNLKEPDKPQDADSSPESTKKPEKASLENRLSSKKNDSPIKEQSPARVTNKGKPMSPKNSEEKTPNPGEKFITTSVSPTQSGIIIIAEEARKKGDTEEAIHLYRKYLSLYRDPSVMNNLGALLITKGRFSEAEQILQEAFQIRPDEDIAFNLIGVEVILGKRKRACEVLHQVKKIKSELPSSFKDLETKFCSFE